MLSELSIVIGRQLGERHGQTITLELQTVLMWQRQDVAGAVAAASILRELRARTGGTGTPGACDD
ncbi:MAG: hypothetical protein GKR94_17340 [Gammaproteobacteria bacterium]|nr:hypothetical protein [Gammaproteobacteria bacterium]